VLALLGRIRAREGRKRVRERGIEECNGSGGGRGRWRAKGEKALGSCRKEDGMEKMLGFMASYGYETTIKKMEEKKVYESNRLSPSGRKTLMLKAAP
jgi:hypothetical protein